MMNLSGFLFFFMNQHEPSDVFGFECTMVAEAMCSDVNNDFASRWLSLCRLIIPSLFVYIPLKKQKKTNKQTVSHFFVINE